MLTIKDKYFYENDKPFFWLGDTAWLMLDKLEFNDIKLYLRNRKSLGYNVIQVVLVYSLIGHDELPGMPSSNKDTTSIEYFSFAKEVISYAKSLGIYVALLPCWGSFVKNNILTIDNVDRYAKFLNEFYNELDNLIWVVGGDIRGDLNYELFNRFGIMLKSYNKDRLVTFHPFGRTGSYLWFNDCSWLDFNMFQSGHRRYDQLTLNAWDDKATNEDSFGEDNYKYVIKNFSYNIKKPCLDSEPSYEGIVQGLHDVKEPYWEARHVRRYAYWSVLEGASGFTYGNNAIIQFFNYGEKGAYGVRENWYEALHSPGGAQMQYLKELMLKINFNEGNAHPEYILNQRERHHRTSCFAGESFIICYNYCGDLFEVDLKKYKDKTLYGYWMNPENNSKSFIGEFSNLDSNKFRPTKRKELANDWVLLLLEKEI